ncbi:hypothetical protein AMTR_s00022p00045270 [Amborella trichopoda]|uniref:Methyltransferase type 11 domain-containing protein n=2 Tax=Amborella trichopoda TaxID=13333 RepID=W1PUP2_AMBTC|nr:hypothetical protein AMTR_s00022p00045270 [Amborella trichopoda]
MEVLSTLGDFTSKENWDKFFTLRGINDPFEWYAEWSILQTPLLNQLQSNSAKQEEPIQILVPGCGNSRLSEQLYDSGFHSITNIDFSKVVVSDMLRNHIRSRPNMRWRVMDMTQMQFADGSFDVVLDKGGLDALMEPQLGPKLGSQYLSEVKRVLKVGGKYICLTLAESHVIELLLSKFRFGWHISLEAILNKPSNKSNFQTFLVVVARENSSIVSPIVPSFDSDSLDCDGNQIHGLLKTINSENKIRAEFSSDIDVLYSLEDLQLGAKGDLNRLIPGRRFSLTLGDFATSHFSYKAILMDSKQPSEAEPFLYQCGVFIVPKTRAHEWLFCSEEGQWMVVESAKVARLIMVFLGSEHNNVGMDTIQKDLSPLVKTLAPEHPDNGDQIPFMMANDGVKQRNIVQQVTSPTTGLIIVEDVIYEESPNGTNSIPLKALVFRRLTFERSLGLVQSECLLKEMEPCQKDVAKIAKKKKKSRHKSDENIRKKRADSSFSKESRNNLKVDHSYLASSYHSGIIAGFALISSALENMALARTMVNTFIIGLGAGLLPMFLHKHFPLMDIEVVELDPIVLDLARNHFDFIEDIHLKVQIADGIKFVREMTTASTLSNRDDTSGNDIYCEANLPSLQGSKGPHILIIDADSADLSTGLTCPPADFTEKSFLLSVKEALSSEGLFIINLVSRSSSIHEMVVSRLKTVFSHIFFLEIEEDVNKVLFVLPKEPCIEGDHLMEAAGRLEKLLKTSPSEKGPNIRDTARRIKRL